ncbi:hypothetical protein XBO1_2110003 [Xenorhabdus bovienii str. oregonense]|uniref:Uncharacterized protein n=1 Tax=Xenorhabdus bovienii str. oregonense TaxID=1398202 RepID=A0A077P4K2_XENBV|nr:hypothetical protein XBO1_2110003 [Xenorhabdus bovienii str. oregonense]
MYKQLYKQTKTTSFKNEVYLFNINWL